MLLLRNKQWPQGKGSCAERIGLRQALAQASSEVLNLRPSINQWNQDNLLFISFTWHPRLRIDQGPLLLREAGILQDLISAILSRLKNRNCLHASIKSGSGSRQEVTVTNLAVRTNIGPRMIGARRCLVSWY